MTLTEPRRAKNGGNDDSESDVRSGRGFFPDEGIVFAALENAKIGVWAWDIASNKVIWSANLEEIHCLPKGRFDSTFAAFENDIHPDDRTHVRNEIAEALRTHEPRRMLYRLPPRENHPERWIESIATVAIEGGKPVRMQGTCRDVTERIRLHRELRIRASQQQAVAKLSGPAFVENDLQKFFDDAVAMIAETLDVELVKILEIVPGEAELIVRSGVGWSPSLIGSAQVSSGPESQAGFTLAHGGPVVVENFVNETRFAGAPLLHEHKVISGVTIPIAGRDGRAYGVLGTHSTKLRTFTDYDVSFLEAVASAIAGVIQRRQLDLRHELMIRELRHRSGNLFSQLLALFSQTAKSSKNLVELVPKYEARVLALANAHRLVTEGGWKSASLMELLNTLLAPYLDRIAFAGPNVFLEADPTFGLSMAIHELATNASKHGSLAQRPGKVEVTWQVKRTDQGLTLVFLWSEREGPAPKRQRRTGFGSRLINMVIERQLNGRVQLSFGPDGLDAELVVPLTHERWPGSAAGAMRSPEPAVE